MSGSAGDAPVLEGEHRLGEGMRRGVFCLGLVPVATGLTLREAMWMQCCLTAGVEPGPMPAHAFRRRRPACGGGRDGRGPGSDARDGRGCETASAHGGCGRGRGVCLSVRPPPWT